MYFLEMQNNVYASLASLWQHFCPFQSIHRTRGPATVDKLDEISHIQVVYVRAKMRYNGKPLLFGRIIPESRSSLWSIHSGAK